MGRKDNETESAEPAVAGLSEIAIRVSDLDRMQAFYEGVVGLPVRSRFDSESHIDSLDGPPRKIVFFHVAPDLEGRPQLLALFDRSDDPDYSTPEQARSTLDHLALEIPISAYDDERERLEAQGIDVVAGDMGRARSLYFKDPEGNEVELVAPVPAGEQRG